MSEQQVTLQTVVDQKALWVADYQRPYAWERQQLQDLWDDLDLLGSKKRHYAGTLVLRRTSDQVKATSAGVNLVPHEVVDGQQRLITCLLLLDRIRRKIQEFAAEEIEDAAEVASDLRRRYGIVKMDGVPQPILRLADDLNEVWQDEILGDATVAKMAEIPGVTRIRAGAAFFDERLESVAFSVGSDVAFGRLKDLIKRITWGLQFLVYQVESTAEVGVIFRDTE